MRIVLWGINYHPEATGIAPFTTELAEFLGTKGHDVAVVTGFPYYPQWKKSRGDTGRLFRTERIGGTVVHRCWQFVPERVTTFRRIAHELSFVLMSFLRVLMLRRADIYFVVSPPLALGFFAWIASRLKSSRYVFHVQDLQPDAAVGLGMVSGGAFVSGLYALERIAYRHAAAVSGISHGMMESFARKGVPAERRILFPNWLRELSATPVARGDFRSRYCIPQSACLAVYSGNIGRKQGIDVLVEAAHRLSLAPLGDPARRVLILIAGAGAGREALDAAIKRLAPKNVLLLPLLDDEDYAAMLAAADVALITQAAGTGRFFFPSKLLSVLRAGLPVLAVADEESELALAVADGRFGVTVPPEAPDQLADALRTMGVDPAQMDEFAQRTNWVQRFRPSLVLPLFAQRLEALVPTVPGAVPVTPAEVEVEKSALAGS